MSMSFYVKPLYDYFGLCHRSLLRRSAFWQQQVWHSITESRNP